MLSGAKSLWLLPPGSSKTQKKIRDSSLRPEWTTNESSAVAPNFTGVCRDLVLSSACLRVRSFWRSVSLPFVFPSQRNRPNIPEQRKIVAPHPLRRYLSIVPLWVCIGRMLSAPPTHHFYFTRVPCALGQTARNWRVKPLSLRSGWRRWGCFRRCIWLRAMSDSFPRRSQAPLLILYRKWLRPMERICLVR